MSDTTIQKVSSGTPEAGPDGQIHLAAGKRLSMRMWRNEEPHEKPSAKRDYETVGYVVSGRAELTVEGNTIGLEPGDSWLVPSGAVHSYKILETFTAIEATAPPA